MEKKVSIIVPIYKVEKYINRCIDSILNQTYKNLEIILVDDGSPDNCGKICDEYSIKDDRIKVIHKPNGGLSDARNAGYNLSSGDYIMFIDSDDWIEAKMVEVMVNNIETYSSDLAICGTKTVGDFSCVFNNWFSSDCVLKKEEALQKLIENNPVTSHAWNKIYKRDLFKDIEWPVGELYEDVRIMHNIFVKCDNVSISKEYLYNYYEREDSICGENKITTKFELVDSFIQRKKELSNFGIYYKELSTYKAAMIVAHLFWDNKFTKNEKKQFKEKFNSYKKILNDKETKYAIKKFASNKEKILISLVNFLIKSL